MCFLIRKIARWIMQVLSNIFVHRSLSIFSLNKKTLRKRFLGFVSDYVADILRLPVDWGFVVFAVYCICILRDAFIHVYIDRQSRNTQNSIISWCIIYVCVS